MGIKSGNGIDTNSYKKDKQALSCQLTVSPDKPAENPSTDNTLELPSDLAGIVQAWPSIPDQIKQAVKAVLAPYLDKEGGK